VKLRTILINICLGAVLTSPVNVHAESPPVSNIQDKTLWEQYKSAFIQDDGRVIDKWQKNISHSEGQGYGMLNSVLYDDRAAFQNLWLWTKNNLQSRKDSLFAWAWGKRLDEQWGIIDYNNATDGDILIAFALLKASGKWHDSGYNSEALKIIESIRKYLQVNRDNRIFILPAYYGFQKEDAAVLNPSYVILPAYRAFAEIDDKAFWSKVYEDGLFLLEKSSFGKFKLPADWVSWNKTGISIYEEKSPLFGYESIRTFLYLSWEKNPKFPLGLHEIFKIYEKLGYIPLFVDLSKNTISLDEAPAGFYAVYARAAEKRGLEALSRRLFAEARKRAAAEKDNYYSMSLLLLAVQNAGQ
jgi:endo-1,4-beta-D-glucanase Y